MISLTPSKQPAKLTIGQQAARGFAWTLLQAFLQKGCTFASQIVLAWLLLPEDFGLVGLAYSVSAFTVLIQKAGIREVLVHRHSRFRRWANAAFWMSLVSGLFAGGMLVLLSPLAARAYGEPRLVGLLLILAITSPLVAASTVPHAKLQSQLRFGFLARLGMLEAIGQAMLAIGFAAMGLGAFSFVLPKPLIAVFHLVAEWVAARPSIRMTLHIRRWRFLMSDSITVFVGSVLINLIHQGDYIILGILFTAEIVGIYFFAFNLSMQVVTILTTQLTHVLFPALSRITNPVSQTRAFVKACSLLALVGTPLAFLQAALADPVIRLLFAERWHDAIPLFQILSVATAFRIVLGSGGSLLQAQGRFQQRMVLFGCYAPVFLVVVYVGATAGGAVGAAIAVSSYYTALGLFHLGIVIRPGGGTWRDAWGVFAGPLAASTVAIGAAWLSGQWLAGMQWHPAGVAVITTITGPFLYAVIARLIMPERVSDLRHRVFTLYNR